MVKTGLLKTEDKVSGLAVSVQVVKNKLAPAMKKADIGIQFGEAFAVNLRSWSWLVTHKSSKEGSNYLIEGDVISDKHAARYLAENYEQWHQSLFAKIEGLLLELEVLAGWSTWDYQPRKRISQ
ncbi:hypothetical protein GH714_035783 [Hevea brasiliensis]|uniref:Uncharacterized protein n=1 Tax=Hevea brasiliensis TaxID=3981 RepID=A0A6A6M4B6_HEVBR|nr:hypothetical protein GH714_035783 [Hevea brasiliensis]